MGKPCTVQNDEVVSFTNCEMKHFFVKLQKEEDEAICKNHSLSLEFYCTVCKEVICMDCFLLSHKQHETKTIKYAKNEGLDLADRVESIRNGIASGYERIHERALQMKKHLDESERDIIKQVEQIETKIQGLISSIFKKTKLYYECLLGETKNLLQNTLSLCETTMKANKLSKKLKGFGDLQLACMLDDLVTAREEKEKETVNMEEVEQTLHKAHDAPVVIANEEAIFNSVKDLLKHITFDPPQYERSISDDFTFEGYMNGEYVVNMIEDNGNATDSSSVEEENGMFTANNC